MAVGKKSILRAENANAAVKENSQKTVKTEKKPSTENSIRRTTIISSIKSDLPDYLL